MTFAFGSFTLGAALLFSAFKNMSMIDLVLGRPGETIASQGEHHPGNESSGGVAVTSTEETANPTLKGTVVMDGHPVAKWIAKILMEARKAGAWHGRVESGYRSAADQARVCATGVTPCAAPGTSHHQGKAYPSGAVDVTDAPSLNAWLVKHHSKLQWAGAADPVHFSHHYNGGY